MIIICLPGTCQQKKALLESHFSKAEAKLGRLRAAYKIWRQRMCWMWGGGFMAAGLTGCEGGSLPALDLMSFDALIPD
jgi:hypothetical protein